MVRTRSFFLARCVRGQHGGPGLAQAADYKHRQATQDEAGHYFVQAQPAKLLSHQHGDRPDDDAGQRTVARHALPGHRQDDDRASWENLFMEIPNTDGALRYYMASVFDTIAATYCPQKSVTHAGMRAIVDSIGCSPLVFLKGLSTQPTAEISVPLLIDEKPLDASYR